MTKQWAAHLAAWVSIKWSTFTISRSKYFRRICRMSDKSFKLVPCLCISKHDSWWSAMGGLWKLALILNIITMTSSVSYWYHISEQNLLIAMAKCKTAVTPLLMQWSYCSLALSHRYFARRGTNTQHHYTISRQSLLPQVRIVYFNTFPCL